MKNKKIKIISTGIGLISTIISIQSQTIKEDTTIYHNPKALEERIDTIDNETIQRPTTITWGSKRIIKYKPQYINTEKPMTVREKDSIINNDTAFLNYLGKLGIEHGKIENYFTTLKYKEKHPFEFTLHGPNKNQVRIFNNNWNQKFDEGDIITIGNFYLPMFHKTKNGYIIKDLQRDPYLKKYQATINELKKMYPENIQTKIKYKNHIPKKLRF